MILYWFILKVFIFWSFISHFVFGSLLHVPVPEHGASIKTISKKFPYLYVVKLCGGSPKWDWNILKKEEKTRILIMYLFAARVCKFFLLGCLFFLFLKKNQRRKQEWSFVSCTGPMLFFALVLMILTSQHLLQ